MLTTLSRWSLCLVLAGLVPAPAPAREEIPDLDQLPRRIDTRIPAVLEEHLADIEMVAARMPGMDRRKAYLVTLQLESYLEDVVLSANRPVVLYPRAITWLIAREALRGSDKKEIAGTLVKAYQRDRFPALQERVERGGEPAATEGEAP